MPLFQSAEVYLSSGAAGSTGQLIERLQQVSVNWSVPRQNVSNLGRFKPLNNRPVVNYIPVSFSLDAIKSSKEIESNFGLLNSTGVGTVFKSFSNNIDGFGCRNLNILIAPANSEIYNGQINVYSGCLSSYTVSASVGEPARVSCAGEGLDYQNINNFNAKNNFSTESNLIKPENVSISGINFSGIGITGLNIQSFNLSLNLNRQSIFKLGQRFPERPVTEISATLSVNGFLEGLSYFSGLGSLVCGEPMTGSMYFTLIPSCSGGPATTYIAVTPYLDSFNLGASIGAFTSVDLSFSIPISINSGEGGSNLIIL